MWPAETNSKIMHKVVCVVGGGDNNGIAIDGLICNVRSVVSYRIVACVGGQIEDLSVVVYDDADFAGCAESHMSTS